MNDVNKLMVNDKNLTKELIATLFEKIPDWKSITINDVMQLEREFQFANFQNALVFTNNVAEFAENKNHHPMLITEWGKVTVRWWTHTIEGVTEKDFICATETDKIYKI